MKKITVLFAMVVFNFSSAFAALPNVECEIENVLNKHMILENCTVELVKNPHFKGQHILYVCSPTQGNDFFTHNNKDASDTIVVERDGKSVKIIAQYAGEENVFSSIELTKKNGTQNQYTGTMFRHLKTSRANNWKTYDVAELSCRIWQ